MKRLLMIVVLTMSALQNTYGMEVTITDDDIDAAQKLFKPNEIDYFLSIVIGKRSKMQALATEYARACTDNNTNQLESFFKQRSNSDLFRTEGESRPAYLDELVAFKALILAADDNKSLDNTPLRQLMHTLRSNT